jgi:hypothetical protein
VEIGTIDEVAVWNVVLPLQTIAAHFALGNE